MIKVINTLTVLFPVWAIVFSIWAFFDPEPWLSLKDFIVPLLSIVMFSMGLTLNIKDFQIIFKNVKTIFIGLLLQFLLMPFLGFILIAIFDLDKFIAIGVLLVGCAPGGTASNLICYLAKGNVALSISLTVCSTFLAIILMPFLFWFYSGDNIDVPVISMMMSILKIIVFPVALGIIINNLNLQIISKIKIGLPLLALIAILLIIATIIGSNADQVGMHISTISLLIILHNLIGMALSYYFCHLLSLDKKTKRTIAIEIAMQNSGLAAAIAIKYFGAVAAIPAAIYSIWHNISGSIIASYWKKNYR